MLAGLMLVQVTCAVTDAQSLISHERLITHTRASSQHLVKQLACAEEGPHQASAVLTASSQHSNAKTLQHGFAVYCVTENTCVIVRVICKMGQT